jgi:DNA-binding IclR family transcriptional regulator
MRDAAAPVRPAGARTERFVSMARDAVHSPAYRVQVLDRTVGILQVLADARSSLGPAEIAQQLSLHKSTIHRLLASLERHGYIRRQPGNGKYGLGLKLFELGSRAVAGLDLREYAQPVLERLMMQTGETAHLCVMDGGQMISVAIAESRRTVRTPATVGRRSPLHCTAVGKAMLAFLPEPALLAVLKQHPLRKYTSRTLVTRAALVAELGRIRTRGYAIDDEEIEEGLRCVGAPVRNYSGAVVASLSIAGPAFRLSRSRIPQLAEAVVDAAERLSADLGHEVAQKRSRARRAAG